jgi:signal transduction histidine kinase
MRAAARALLDGEPEESAHVNAVAVERWDRPFAALVVRARPEAALNLSVYIRETAAALSPHLEREMLFERNAARERSLVSASERRLVRLGFDLHDGPLQELVAFAEDLRLARDQVTSLLDDGNGVRVRGRFDDLEARLASLDEGLRDIAHAVRSTSSVERPLEHALRQEVDALRGSTGIETALDVDGDIADLTASQKIALLRVVQESLCNVRKHSGATSVQVRVRATSSYVTAVVTDNGRGFDLEEARRSGRLGLTGVVERVRLLGGDVEIDGRTGEGVDVRVTLPRWRPADEPAAPLYAVV